MNSYLQQITLNAIPGPDVPTGTDKIQFHAFRAHVMPPVFKASGNVVVEKLVALTFRNSDGLPVHGGLFGVTADGIVRVALVDERKGVNTDEDPSWVAFGMLMGFGMAVDVECADGKKVAIPWCIADFGIRDVGAVSMGTMFTEKEDLDRRQVAVAYIENVLPDVAIDALSLAKKLARKSEARL